MLNKLTLFDVIKAIPDDVESPTIFYEEDGSVCLDWNIDKHRALSLSVSPSLRLSYAWVIGDYHGSWAEEFTGEFSDLLLSKLKDL